MDAFALLFPGQGSQRVGMGHKLFQTSKLAQSVFEAADNALGFSLTQIMWKGPEEKLRLTEYAQPAILTHSIAAWRFFQETHVEMPAYIAGHSVGEYSALVAAAALTFEDAVRAVHFRGQVMSQTVEAGVGAMAAIVDADPASIQRSCDEASRECPGCTVSIANWNGPDQTVISGHQTAVDHVIVCLKSAGIKKAIKLKVSAPFHSALMEPAQQKLTNYLSGVSFLPAKIPVVSNVTASAESDPSRLRELLGLQVSLPVRFTDMVNFLLRQEVERFVECGPGKVLTGIVKRMCPQANLLSCDGE